MLYERIKRCFLYVNGCLANYNWCDVQTGRLRGWVSGNYLEGFYNDREEYITVIGQQANVPIITFEFNNYWDNYYRNRSFYKQRDYYRSHYYTHDRDYRWDRRDYPRHDRDNDHDWRRDRDRNHDWGGRGNKDNNPNYGGVGGHDRDWNRGRDNNWGNDNNRGGGRNN